MSPNSSDGEKGCKLKNGFRLWSNPAAILLAMTTQDVALRASTRRLLLTAGSGFGFEEIAI